MLEVVETQRLCFARTFGFFRLEPEEVAVLFGEKRPCIDGTVGGSFLAARSFLFVHHEGNCS